MTWRNLVHLRAQPRAARVRDDPADHLRADVRLRLRRRDQGAGRVDYVDFLMAGVWIQSVTFGAVNTGVGLAEDLQAGSDRAVPVAADGALGGARRPDDGRPRAQRLRGAR